MNKAGFLFLNLVVILLAIAGLFLFFYLKTDDMVQTAGSAAAEQGNKDIQTSRPNDEADQQQQSEEDENEKEQTPAEGQSIENEYQYYFLDEKRLQSKELKVLFDSVVKYKTQVSFPEADVRDPDELVHALFDIISDTQYINVVSGVTYVTGTGNIDIKIEYDNGRLSKLKDSLEKAKQIADEIFTDSMSTLEIVKTAHDYIVSNTEYNSQAYDLSFKNPNDDSYPDAYSAYGVFFDKTAVCMGYTYAFNSLLNCEGIETRVLNSEILNHSWSMVELDGGWYHCDVTFDDPVPDIKGQLLYTYFLKNDKYMQDIDVNRIIAGAQRSSAQSYFYEIYNLEIYSTPDGLKGYSLMGDQLCTFDIEDSIVSEATKSVLLDNVSSWFGLGEEYSIVYTQQSDGDIYIAGFDGSSKTLLKAADGLYIINCVSVSDKYVLTCAEGINGRTVETEIQK